MADTTIPFDDAVLVRQCQKGDLTAFEPLVVKYQDRIFNLCWRLCGDRQAAEDLTQEAFLKAFEGLRQFRGKSGFFTWLYRIAANLALSYRRNERRQINIGSSGSLEDLAGQAAKLRRAVALEQERSDTAVERDETRRIVWEAIQSLEDGYREVLVLRDMEAFDYAQIAEVLQMPIGTVKSRLHRARMALRDKLSGVLIDETSDRL
ncbi:MAG: RNA polymerase sigma factor [Phycisphaerae bacterium]